MARLVPARPVAGAPRARRLPAWALVPLAGLLWWVGGYLFWVLAGLRAVSVGARAALPLVPSQIGALVVGALVGSVAAGLSARAAVRRRTGLLASAGGTALAVVLALAATTRSLRTDAPGGGFESEPPVVLGLSAVVVLVSVAGWAVGALAALGRAGTAPGLAVLAGAVPWWLAEVVLSVGGVGGLSGAGTVAAWIGAALLTGALVCAGVRPLARLAWWPPLVLAAWLVAPALTAATYVEQLLRPGTGLPGSLPDSLSAAVEVFGLAALPANRMLGPWIAAVVVAAVVCLVLPRLTRRT